MAPGIYDGRHSEPVYNFGHDFCEREIASLKSEIESLKTAKVELLEVLKQMMFFKDAANSSNYGHRLLLKDAQEMASAAIAKHSK